MVYNNIVLKCLPLGWCVQFWCSSLWNVHPGIARSQTAWGTSSPGNESRVSRPHTALYSGEPWRETKYGRDHWWFGFFMTLLHASVCQTLSQRQSVFIRSGERTLESQSIEMLDKIDENWTMCKEHFRDHRRNFIEIFKLSNQLQSIYMAQI